MKIKTIDHGLDLAANADGFVRSKGLHMSDLYGDYYRSADPEKYDKRDAKGNKLPYDTAKMELGMAFEDILEPLLATRLFGSRPKEQKIRINARGEIDPKGAITLYFSPDHVFFVEGETTLGEFKCTWYSSRGAPRIPKKFGIWITQMKLYCHALDLTKARLYVFFVNSDYKPPTPKLLAWEFTFTQAECAEEWGIIMRHAVEKGLLTNGVSKK
jgi:hypothetical protein